MPLIVITEETVRDYLADAEISAFNNAGADSTKTFPERVGGIIRKACNKVALYVNSYTANGFLKPNQDAVPEELEDSALAIIRNMLLAGLPMMEDLEGSPRAKAYSNAIAELKDVAEGRLPISPFSNMGEEPPATSRILATGEPYLNWNKL